MTDYISREAMINLVEDDGHANEIDLGWPDGNMAFVEMIKELPAADVRPVVRGKWRLGGYGQISDATVKWYDQFLQGGFLYCSVCKGRSSLKFNFCPNCGADMREET
jgi:hypothetical protein